MKTLTLSLSLALALPLLATAPVAAQQAKAAQTLPAATPGKQVVATGNRILDTLRQQRSEFRKHPAELEAFIDKELRTSFDRDYAARLVLGRHGRGASAADIDLFADAMATNLMTRYGAALLTFEGAPQMRLKSETPLPGNRGVRVSTELLRDNGAPVPVDYLVRNNGGWKIFDVMIEGVSYVQTFRNQFDAPLQQKSIAQVAADLRNSARPASASNGQH